MKLFMAEAKAYGKEMGNDLMQVKGSKTEFKRARLRTPTKKNTRGDWVWIVDEIGNLGASTSIEDLNDNWSNGSRSEQFLDSLDGVGSESSLASLVGFIENVLQALD